MYEPIQIKEYCVICGKSYIGTHICPDLFKTDFDRGYSAGKKSVKKEIEPFQIKEYCVICGQSYIGKHFCPDLGKSDYDRGYDSGKKAAKSEFGFSSYDEFPFSGI